MIKHRLKNYLKLGILLFGISVLIIACQQDDLESNQDIQILIPKGKSYVKINTGNDVSGNVVDFLKEKTNNTLGVIIGTDNVRLSINDVAYRTSALGTVDTSKEVVVINETNTKHTFKVDNPNDTSNTVTNIIVVENESDTYEYFLKYNFDDEIPYNEDGTVDLSRFTGTIDAYDSTGQRTGGISISNGEVIDNDGQTTPCPDDTTPPPDNDDDNDNNNQNGGGAQGNIGDGSPDDDVDGNQGGGGWFDGGPDWNPCTISYHRECTNGYSGEHEPTPINSDGDLCSGTLNGAGILVVTDCNGNVLGSGRQMARTGEENTINPCGGTTGVLLTDEPKTNCESLKQLVANDSLGSNILPIVNQLRTKLSAGNNEWSISYKNVWSEAGRKNAPQDDGIQEGISDVESELNYSSTWVGQIHTHPVGTHNMFSWNDIRALKLLHTESFNAFNDEIFLMVVAPNNISYTLRVDDIQSLIDKIDADMQNAEGTTDKAKREYLMENMQKEYAESTNLEHTFLSLFSDYGISLYEATDANLSNWKQLTLNENDNETVNENSCN